MATLHQEVNFNTAFSTGLTCILSSVAAGDALVLCLRERDGSAEPSVSDDVNGTWGASDVTDASPSGTGRASIFSYLNSSSGAITVTISYGASGRVFQGVAAAFSPGAGATFSVDQTSSNSITGSTGHNAGSLTAGAGFVIAAAAHSANSGGETEGANGFTAFSMAAGEREYHRYLLTSGSTLSAPYATVNSINSNQVMCSYLEAGGGTDAYSGRGIGRGISRGVYR